MKLELTCAVSNKTDIFEYIKKACQSAEECGISDNVTLKVTYYDEKEIKPYKDLFSMFSKEGNQ